MSQPWYTIDNIEKLDSPTLTIFKDRVIQNIETILTMVKEVSHLRPHIKTHKSAEVSKMMIDAGIHKFKCATIAEAEMLGQNGAKDVLLAYQAVGPKINRLISLIQSYPNTQFACLIDNVVSATKISEQADIQQIVIPVYIDVNVGMNRTGITSAKISDEWIQNIKSLTGIQLMGIHVYDGHIHDVDLAIRQEKVASYLPKVEKVVELLKHNQVGHQIIMGGSPTFPIHLQNEGIECSPGTFVFWDKGYLDICPEQPFLPAAVLVTRVISIIDEQRLCVDLGYKSIASENPLNRRVYFLNEPEAIPVGHSEEHMVLQLSNTSKYQIGDVFYALPIHICPTVALYKDLKIISDHKWTESWETTARVRAISI